MPGGQILYQHAMTFRHDERVPVMPDECLISDSASGLVGTVWC